jgi:aminopeptidase N
MRRLSVLVLVLITACTKDDYDPARDYFTYANTDQFVSTHLLLDLTVNFETERLEGSATHTMRWLDQQAREIDLDTRDLAISAASISIDGKSWSSATFELAERDKTLGSKLTIGIPGDIAATDRLMLKIHYTTDPKSTALQWLPAGLTSGGEHPMLFSQSQAIHARSWVPLQDTPSVRITYQANVRTPATLLAVMSANNDPETPRDGDYQFEMPQPIPSYLLAIAVGNIYFAPIGEDTGIYAEPEMLDASSYEFADTQAMFEQAEALFGPYEWGRYDLLILPPSFPFGGMENPRLSFLTPSLLAGDRSLVGVVAHELAHSWSGNLVTNATWRDGWLNEGMTSYLESRLMEVIYSKERVDEENVLNYEELLLNLDAVPAAMQALAPRLDNGDADDFQGSVHYHKGKLFLTWLEEAFGRDVFDDFLFGYFETFAFKTITSEVFLDYLDENLLTRSGSEISRADAEEWLYRPGLPKDAPIPSSRTLDASATLAAAWSAGEIDTADISIEGWSPQAVIHFINNLAADLPQARLAEIDNALQLSATSNAEIGRTWFIQVAQRRFEPAYPQMAAHLERYGRVRLIRPIYAALAENGEDLELAREIFSAANSGYHPLTVAAILGILYPDAPSA